MEVQDDSIPWATRPFIQQTARQPEQSKLPTTNGQLETAAPSQAVAEQWIQLNNNLHYILVSTCDGPASTMCRQNAQGNSLETWRPLHLRYSIPLGNPNHSSMNRSLKRALHHGTFNSPSMNKTITHFYQTQSKSQYCSMRQKDHYSNTYSYNQETTEQHQHPGNSNNRGPAPMATRYNNGKGKRHCKGIGKRYKDNKDIAKAKDTAIKENARGTTTINQEENEQKNSKQQMDNQDKWSNNVEWRSTTATLATSTSMTRQMIGAVRHTIAATGTTRTRQLALPQPTDSSAAPISGL